MTNVFTLTTLKYLPIKHETQGFFYLKSSKIYQLKGSKQEHAISQVNMYSFFVVWCSLQPDASSIKKIGPHKH